jgi:hypothetical protein
MTETFMAHLTSHYQLAEAIREAYAGASTMVPAPEEIARDLLDQHTFGGDLRQRGGKMVLANLRMAVAMFLEHEATDDASIEAIERAQDFIAAIGDANSVGFTVQDLELLRPLDQQRFYRLLLNAADWESVIDLHGRAVATADEPEVQEAAQ